MLQNTFLQISRVADGPNFSDPDPQNFSNFSSFGPGPAKISQFFILWTRTRFQNRHFLPPGPGPARSDPHENWHYFQIFQTKDIILKVIVVIEMQSGLLQNRILRN